MKLDRSLAPLAKACWTRHAGSVCRLLAALPDPNLEGRACGVNDLPRAVMKLLDPDRDRVSPVDVVVLSFLDSEHPELQDVSILKLLQEAGSRVSYAGVDAMFMHGGLHSRLFDLVAFPGVIMSGIDLDQVRGTRSCSMIADCIIDNLEGDMSGAIPGLEIFEVCAKAGAGCWPFERLASNKKPPPVKQFQGNPVRQEIVDLLWPKKDNLQPYKEALIADNMERISHCMRCSRMSRKQLCIEIGLFGLSRSEIIMDACSAVQQKPWRAIMKDALKKAIRKKATNFKRPSIKHGTTKDKKVATKKDVVKKKPASHQRT